MARYPLMRENSMANKRYVSGRNFEYRVQRILEKGGWLVLRSAGSHGVFDLIAVNGYITVGVQCKANGRISKAEIGKMLEASRGKAIIPALALRKGRGIEWRLVGNE